MVIVKFSKHIMPASGRVLFLWQAGHAPGRSPLDRKEAVAESATSAWKQAHDCCAADACACLPVTT